MSAQIKRYQMWEASHALALDDVVVLHSDHLAAMAAASAFDEAKERGLFEAAMREIHKGDLRNLESWHVGGYYVHHIQEMWEIWKACAKARAKTATS